MSDQVNPMTDFLDAIERERRAWDALQQHPNGASPDSQTLHAAWVTRSTARTCTRSASCKRTGHAGEP